jgi:uncharacterized protein YjiS (DUF1127 family)
MTNMIKSHSSTNAWAAELPVILGTPISIARTLVRRLRERRALNRLLSLPDYLLNDVGLQRHDIQREALKPLWRD